MKKFQNLEDLKQLKNNSVNYEGKLKEYQEEGSSKDGVRYQNIRLNDTQYKLYMRCLKGIKVYEASEIKKMNPLKVQRIKKVHIKAQQCLNIYKQEVTNQFCSIFASIFHNSELAQGLFGDKKIRTSSKYFNTLSFKDLGITRDMIIKRFIDQGILPKNFYDLKEAA